MITELVVAMIKCIHDAPLQMIHDAPLLMIRCIDSPVALMIQKLVLAMIHYDHDATLQVISSNVAVLKSEFLLLLIIHNH